MNHSLYRLHVQEKFTEQQPISISHVIATVNGSWRLWIWGHLINRDGIPDLQLLPDTLDVTTLQRVLSYLETAPLCKGVCDDQLLQMATPKNAIVKLVDRSDLVYDKNTSRIIGFVNLGAVDQQLITLEKGSTPAIATRVLTVMVREIF